MKYVLIGGSGFIGQHFIKALGDKMAINLDIDSGVNDTPFDYCNILDEENLKEVDLSKWAELTIIHLAAVHFDFQTKYFETNVKGTRNVIDFLSKHGNIKKYVYFSSVATYGDSINGKDEHALQEPYNDYGKSKLEAEKLILEWHKKFNHIQTVIVRPAVVFGEFNFGNVFNLIQQLRSGFFAIIGSGENIKSIAYAPNLVKSVLFTLTNVNEPLFIYNYSDYPQLKISEQCDNILRALEKKSPPIKIPLILTKLITKPIDLLEKLTGRDLKVNSMRVKKFTVPTFFNSDLIREKGYVQQYSIEEALSLTIKWIETTDTKKLRDKWIKKASKL